MLLGLLTISNCHYLAIFFLRRAKFTRVDVPQAPNKGPPLPVKKRGKNGVTEPLPPFQGSPKKQWEKKEGKMKEKKHLHLTPINCHALQRVPFLIKFHRHRNSLSFVCE